jgi:hypothetical protein
VSRRVPIDEGPQSVRRYHKAKQESVMRTITTLAVGLIVLTACNKPQNENRMALKTFDVMEAPPPAAADIKITHPEIAYTYSYTFRLPAERIADAQRAHIALCDQVGFAHCHMLQMNRDADGIGTGGSLKLEVDAAIARKFGHQMSDQVAGAGGAQVGTSITAEDLSKQIVDTEARLRSKELLAARLTELLRTRKGPVARRRRRAGRNRRRPHVVGYGSWARRHVDDRRQLPLKRSILERLLGADPGGVG